MRTSTTAFVAASLILSAGFVQAQNQQQTDQQNQQQNQTVTPSQQQPQLNSAPSSDSQSSGQSGGNMSQGTSQDNSQGTSQGSSQSGSGESNSSQSQSTQSQSSGSQSTPQSTSSDQAQNDTVQSRLQPKTENGITYLCGGVGEEQASYMKQSKGDYDLMLTFATRSGEYLADVDVAIKDAKGKQVLQTKCDGPMLLVNLPRSGAYRVQAQAEDYSLRKTVNVKAKGNTRSVVMVWPRDPAEGTASVGSSEGTAASGSSGDNENSSSSGKGSSKTKKLKKHSRAKKSEQ
jgi:hypothetical protein